MNERSLRRAAEALRAAPAVAIACHVNPDADALGSMLGLAGHLRGAGVRVVVLVPERTPRVARWAALAPRHASCWPNRCLPAAPT